MTVWGPGMPKYGREGRPLHRKRSIKSVKASCDRLWSQIVRASGVCERCGATENERQLHPHHVYGRANHRLRFEPRNGVCLCATCHRWGHGNPIPFADWFREHRPEDAEWLAEENRNGLLKRNLQDYLELEERLKGEISASDSTDGSPETGEREAHGKSEAEAAGEGG